MKLATLAREGSTTAAVVRAAEVATIPGYEDVGALLRAGDAGREAAHEAAAQRVWSELVAADLRAPILEPGAVFCVGLNFAAHIREMGRDIPEHPTIFAKLARTIAGPTDVIALPEASSAVDYEGELVAVIGTAGKDIPRDEARAHLAGYTLMNDVSMRDWQYRTIEWFAGKNFERSTPVGPWLVTPDEFDPVDASLDVCVNGEPRQSAPLADLVFDTARLIEDISTFTTLLPGDLIATGTPGGVGHAMSPRRYLTDGDVVEVTVDGLGTLSSAFAAAR